MNRVRLGELLVREGKIDNAQLQSALAYQKRWGKKLGECIVHLGFLTEAELCHALSRALRLPLIDITKIDPQSITKELLDKISIQKARTCHIVPISIRDIKNKKRLVVATSDPTNYKLMDELQFNTGLTVLCMIAPESDIDWFIRKFYLSEAEVLPINYVSQISIIDTKESQEDFLPDPISNIFWDSEFTGVTNMRPPKSKDDKNDKGKK